MSEKLISRRGAFSLLGLAAALSFAVPLTASEAEAQAQPVTPTPTAPAPTAPGPTTAAPTAPATSGMTRRQERRAARRTGREERREARHNAREMRRPNNYATRPACCMPSVISGVRMRQSGYAAAF